MKTKKTEVKQSTTNTKDAKVSSAQKEPKKGGILNIFKKNGAKSKKTAQDVAQGEAVAGVSKDMGQRAIKVEASSVVEEKSVKAKKETQTQTQIQRFGNWIKKASKPKAKKTEDTESTPKKKLLQRAGEKIARVGISAGVKDELTKDEKLIKQLLKSIQGSEKGVGLAKGERKMLENCIHQIFQVIRKELPNQKILDLGMPLAGMYYYVLSNKGQNKAEGKDSLKKLFAFLEKTSPTAINRAGLKVGSFFGRGILVNSKFEKMYVEPFLETGLDRKLEPYVRAIDTILRIQNLTLDAKTFSKKVKGKEDQFDRDKFKKHVDTVLKDLPAADRDEIFTELALSFTNNKEAKVNEDTLLRLVFNSIMHGVDTGKLATEINSDEGISGEMSVQFNYVVDALNFAYEGVGTLATDEIINKFIANLIGGTHDQCESVIAFIKENLKLSEDDFKKKISIFTEEKQKMLLEARSLFVDMNGMYGSVDKFVKNKIINDLIQSLGLKAEAQYNFRQFMLENYKLSEGEFKSKIAIYTNREQEEILEAKELLVKMSRNPLGFIIKGLDIPEEGDVSDVLDFAMLNTSKLAYKLPSMMVGMLGAYGKTVERKKLHDDIILPMIKVFYKDANEVQMQNHAVVMEQALYSMMDKEQAVSENTVTFTKLVHNLMKHSVKVGSTYKSVADMSDAEYKAFVESDVLLPNLVESLLVDMKSDLESDNLSIQELKKAIFGIKDEFVSKEVQDEIYSVAKIKLQSALEEAKLPNPLIRFIMYVAENHVEWVISFAYRLISAYALVLGKDRIIEEIVNPLLEIHGKDVSEENKEALRKVVRGAVSEKLMQSSWLVGLVKMIDGLGIINIQKIIEDSASGDSELSEDAEVALDVLTEVSMADFMLQFKGKDMSVIMSSQAE